MMESTHLLALTSFDVLTGLASIYLGLIVCWGTYWLFFGISEKRRESQVLAMKSQLYRQQNEQAAVQRELSATVEAFVLSKNHVHSLQLEVTDLIHRVDQLESAQFEWEQNAITQQDAQEAPRESAEVDLAVPSDRPSSLSLYGAELCGSGDTVITKVDSELGLIYTQVPETSDDLTEIWGIGGVNQRKLQEHGVYFFEQISQWTASNALAFNAILGFKGRIEREGWISQADQRVTSSEEGFSEAA